jgi:hypothetical protein
MADQGTVTNWRDVAKAALWPALVLYLVMYFGTPLGLALDRISAELGPTQEVDLGPVKLQFSPRSAARLPAPSTAVATALAKMKSSDIETLLAMSDNGQMIVCTVHGITERANDFERHEAIRYDALVSIGLVDNSNPINDNDPGCAKGESRGFALTSFGKAARAYLLGVIESALTFSKT